MPPEDQLEKSRLPEGADRSHAQHAAAPIDLVKAAYEACLPRMRASLERFPFERRDAYANWLAQTYGYVFHTTRLTALAAARVSGVFDSLHRPMLRHAAEEEGHELLLADDLRAIGARIEDFRPLPETVAFYECLYYQIDHQSPLAIYGRILPLEGVSALLSAKLRARVVGAHGDHAATFLKAHGDADPEHIEQAFALLASITEREATIIARGIEITVALYVHILDASGGEPGPR